MKNNQVLLATVMTLSMTLGSLQGFALTPAPFTPDSQAPQLACLAHPKRATAPARVPSS